MRTIFKNEEVYFCGIDLFNFLNLKWKGKDDLKKRNINDNWVTIENFLTNGGNQKLIFINKKAVIHLCFSNSKLDFNYKKDLLTNLGISENDLKLNRPEIDFVNILCPILDGFGLKYILQYPINNYKIDIYIPKIGYVEYDELSGHYNKQKDLKRETEIQKINDKPFYRCKQGEEKQFITKIVKLLLENTKLM